MPRSPIIPIVSLAIISSLVVLLAVTAQARNRIYRSEVALWEAAVRTTPGKRRPHHNLGHALALEGRHEEALQAFARVLGLPEDGSVHMPFLYLEQGKAFYYLGRYGDAITAWTRALALAPGDPEALTNIAVALLEQGRLDEAGAYGRSALAAPAPPAEAFEVLGEVAHYQGKHREAASLLAEALRRKPGLLSAYRTRALALEAAGDDRAALSLVREYQARGVAGPDHREMLELGERLSKKISDPSDEHPERNNRANTSR